ncbi:MAG: PASTA domain-containing protein [Acidimicrobiales bacterium]
MTSSVTDFGRRGILALCECTESGASGLAACACRCHRWMRAPPSTSATTTSAKRVTVPDVVGMPLPNADLAIKGVGLRYTAKQVKSNTVPAVTVISQQPPAGSPVPLASSVAMIVSAGPLGLTP